VHLSLGVVWNLRCIIPRYLCPYLYVRSIAAKLQDRYKSGDDVTRENRFLDRNLKISLNGLLTW
jgi:hypothetical protein